MEEEHSSHDFSWLQVVPQGAAVVSILVGLGVLTGWFLDVRFLKALIPGQPPVRPVNAGALIASGLALWLLREGAPGVSRRRGRKDVAGRLCALGAVVVGFWTLGEYLLDRHAGIDTFLIQALQPGFREAQAGARTTVGSLAFIFAGGGLLGLDWETHKGYRPTELLAFGAILEGIFGVLDFVLHPAMVTSGVSAITSMLFVAQGGALLVARREHRCRILLTSRGLGGRTFRRLLPAAVAVPIVLGWLMWRGQRAGLYAADLGATLTVVLSITLLVIITFWATDPLEIADRERTRAQEALRRSENSLAEAERIAHLGNWDWDIVRNELRWSDEIYRMFGLVPQAFGATYEAFLAAVHPDDRDTVRRAVVAALAGREPYRVDHRIVRPDGTVRIVHQQAEVFFDTATGRPLRMLGTVQDITDQKQAEEAARRLNRALRTISECNQALVRVRDEAELLQEICRILVEHGDYPLAWVGYAEHEEPRLVRPVASAGVDGGSLAGAKLTWDESERGQEPAGRAIRTGQPVVARGPRTGSPSSELAPFVALPLIAEGQAFGVLMVYAQSPEAFEEEEVGLLLEFSRDVAFGVQTLRTRAERQRAEEALRQAGAYNRNLIETTLDPLVTIAPDGKITDVNQATEKATGRSRAEIIGTDFCEYFTDPAKARAGYLQVFREGSVRDYELEIRHRDGHVTPVLYNASVYRDEAGSVTGVFAAARDITERNRALDLVRTQARQRAAVSALGQLALSGTGLQALMDEAVVSLAETLGVEYAKVLELLPDGRKFLLRAGAGWKEGLTGRATVGAGHDSQAGFTLLSGEPVVVEDLGAERRFQGPSLLHEHGVVSGLSVTIRGQDKPYGILGAHTQCRRRFTQDEVHFLQTVANVLAAAIQRNQAEAKVRRANDYNRSLIETTLDPLVTIAPDGKITDVNQATEKATGRSRAEVIGTDFCEYFTDPGKARAGYLQVFREGSVRDYELEIRHRDGHVTPVLYNASVYRDEAGAVLGVFAAARDISKRKEAEKIITLQAGQYRSLVGTTSDGYWHYHPDGKLLEVNDAYCRMSGYSREELLGKRIPELEALEKPEEVAAHIRKVLETGFDRFESQHRRKDGTVFDVEISVSYRRENDLLLLFCRDISARKQAERELQRLNRALRTLSESNQAMVRARDELGLLHQVCRILVEHGGYRLAWVGYAEQDEEHSVRPMAGVGDDNGYLAGAKITWADDEYGRGPTGRAIRTGRPMMVRDAREEADFAPWREAATQRGIASSIALPLIAEGQTIGALMVYSGVADAFDPEEVELLTELAQDLAFGIQSLRTRGELDRALRELRELSARLLQSQDEERRRIARELHDSTGQELAALAMDLAALQQGHSALDLRSQSLVAECVDLVNRSSQEIRNFSYLLHPPVLDEFGLASALRWYVKGFAERSGIEVRLEVPLDLIRLPRETETALFRIVQECLANIHRHSGSRTAQIRIQEEHQQLVLEVEDRGHGLPTGPPAGGLKIARAGVGVTGMRERMRLLGGQLEVRSHGQGTVVRASLPLVKEAAS